MRELLLRLIAHMRWADALVAGALETTPNADAERLFAHVAAAEHVWYARVRGQPAAHSVWPALSASQARDLASENADAYERLVAESSDDDLSRLIYYTNTAGRAFDNSLADIITHVTTHGSYHRGQIALRIREAGHTPPYTDYIGYTRRNQ